jgi:hypothetical protein
MVDADADALPRQHSPLHPGLPSPTSDNTLATKAGNHSNLLTSHFIHTVMGSSTPPITEAHPETQACYSPGGHDVTYTSRQDVQTVYGLHAMQRLLYGVLNSSPCITEAHPKTQACYIQSSTHLPEDQREKIEQECLCSRLSATVPCSGFSCTNSIGCLGCERCWFWQRRKERILPYLRGELQSALAGAEPYCLHTAFGSDIHLFIRLEYISGKVQQAFQERLKEQFSPELLKYAQDFEAQAEGDIFTVCIHFPCNNKAGSFIFDLCTKDL